MHRYLAPVLPTFFNDTRFQGVSYPHAKGIMSFRFRKKKKPTDLCTMSSRFTEDQQRDYAQLLYTRFDETEQNIACKTGASQAAIRKWIVDGQWGAMRRSLLTARETQLEILYDILHSITTRIREDTAGGNTKDADLVIKYTAAIKNLEAETSTGQIIEVAKLFISWVQPTDLHLAKTITLQFDAFIRDRLKKAA